MSLLYFILACYGITQILVYGSIFNKFRPDAHFFHCPMCIGWWVGLFLWVLNSQTELFTFDNSFVTALVLASVSSGTSYVLITLFGDEGIKLKIWRND